MTASKEPKRRTKGNCPARNAHTTHTRAYLCVPSDTIIPSSQTPPTSPISGPIPGPILRVPTLHHPRLQHQRKNHPQPWMNLERDSSSTDALPSQVPEPIALWSRLVDSVWKHAYLQQQVRRGTWSDLAWAAQQTLGSSVMHLRRRHRCHWRLKKKPPWVSPKNDGTFHKETYFEMVQVLG